MLDLKGLLGKIKSGVKEIQEQIKENKKELESGIALNNVYYNDPTLIRGHVVSLCEQVLDLSKIIDDIRDEYDNINACLNDVQIIEELEEEKKKILVDVAKQYRKNAFNHYSYLNAMYNISETIFPLIEKESNISTIIHQYKTNKSKLEQLKEVIEPLTKEKNEWSRRNKKRKESLVKLKKLLPILFLVVDGLAILFLVIGMIKKWNLIPIILFALFAVLIARYLKAIKQKYENEIKQSEENFNYINSLECRNIITYENAKNTVDYIAASYLFDNIGELEYNYEQYKKIRIEEAKFKLADTELDNSKALLLNILSGLKLHDVQLWLYNVDAIIEEKTMDQFKQETNTRCQILRTCIDNNTKAIAQMKKDIDMFAEQIGDDSNVVNEED